MATLIYFGAGHGKYTPGKRSPSGIFEEREWFFNNEVAVAFENRMKQYKDVKLVRTDDRTGERDVTLRERTNAANKANADVYVSFHHNAYLSKWGDWTGVEVYYHNGSTKGKAIAEAVLPAVVNAYGLRNRGIKTNNLHITRETKMPAILIEGGFMDSTIDIEKLRNKSVLRNAGESVADALAKHLGLVLSDDKSKPVTPPKKDDKSDNKGNAKQAYTGSSIVMYLQSIGQPYSFSDRNKLAIKYGIKNYTGTAKQNTDLLAKLRGDKKPSKPKAPTPKPKPKAKPSAKLVVDGLWGAETTRALQRYFKTTVDGVISGQPSNRSTRNIPSAKIGTGGSQLIRAMQRHYGTTVDGQISGTSQLIRAMQRKYGTTADGYVSKPSELVREIQRRLNNGTL